MSIKFISETVGYEATFYTAAIGDGAREITEGVS